MNARRQAVALGAFALMAAPVAAGSEITVQWSGDFGIPDIVDPPGVFIEIEVTPDVGGMNVIEDMDLGLIISTTWQGDLIISLEHEESGRFHRLLDRPGSLTPDGYGYSADNYGNLATGERFILDDEAPNPYDIPWVEGHGIPDVTGRWQPDTDPLSMFDGDSIVGTWRLWFADQGGGDLAFVKNIDLHFTTVPAPGAAAPLALWLLRRRRPRPTPPRRRGR